MTTDAQTISMAPAFVNFTDLVQGDTLAFTVALTDSAGDAIDITGTTTDMEIKRLDGTTVLALSIGDGITYTNAAGGIMNVTVAAADTADLEPEYTYRYDLQYTNGSTVRTIASGTIKLIKQITD